MSKYDRLIEQIETAKNAQEYARAIAQVSGVLREAADDIKRLWDATKPEAYSYYGLKICPVCKAAVISTDPADIIHSKDCPHEALRPLFGEGADRE